MREPRNHRIIITARGGPEVLELIEEPRPKPGPNDVRIKVAAAGVSAYDLLTRSISMPGNPKPPFTPGEELANLDHLWVAAVNAAD